VTDLRGLDTGSFVGDAKDGKEEGVIGENDLSFREFVC